MTVQTDCTTMPLHIIRVFSKQVYAIIYIIVLIIGICKKHTYAYAYTRVYKEHLDKNVCTVLGTLTILSSAYAEILIDI